MIKETDLIVADELDDFYDDVYNDSRKLKFLLQWQFTVDAAADVPKMEFKPPKKKFKPKVKRPSKVRKNGRHGRSATF